MLFITVYKIVKGAFPEEREGFLQLKIDTKHVRNVTLPIVITSPIARFVNLFFNSAWAPLPLLELTLISRAYSYFTSTY